MMRREIACLSLCCIFTASSAVAQPSTGNAKGPLRPVAVELAVGREFKRFTGGDAGPAATAITASVTSGLDHIGGMRATAWYIHRSSRPENDGWGEATLLVIAVAAEIRLHLIPNRLVLTPMIGYGFSPYVAGMKNAADYPDVRMTKATSTGKNWLGGVSLRMSHVFIEWAAIGLLGAEDVVQGSREYYPLSIGVRY